MGLSTNTTVKCDCCGYSFTDGAPGEIYATMSIPGASVTSVKLFCYTKGCHLHMPSSITAKFDAEAAAHLAAEVTTAVTSPTAPTVAAVAGAGTFAAGSKFWKITAINAVGETLPSGEATLAVAANDAVDISWTKVAGATGYKVYRATTSQTYTDPALVATVGDVATYRDTGAATTAGTLPTANTTVGIPVFTSPLVA